MNTFSRRIKSAAMVGTVLVGVLYFLFFTDTGVEFLCKLAVRMGYSPYSRFVAYRIAARGTPEAFSASAEMFMELAVEDLVVARQMSNQAIQLGDNSFRIYKLRGDINMYACRFSEAKADYEKALRYWRTGGFDSGSVEHYSNCIMLATGCLEAQQKARAKGNFQQSKRTTHDQKQEKTLDQESEGENRR